MKITLLGKMEDNSFVRMIEERYSVEWADKPGDVNKECAFVIIMTLDQEHSMLQKNELLEQGLAEDVILEYCCFIKDPTVSRMEYFQNEYCEYEYDSFWFGMSHSLGGLIEDIIKKKSIYKFSAPSMDLYYHYQVLRRIEKIYDMKKIKNIYFELPYYIFNYDVSRCTNIFQQRINYFYFLQEYHHFSETQAGRCYIDMFEKMNELTGNRFYGRFSVTEGNIVKNRKNLRLSKAKRNIYFAICNKEKHKWTEDEICTLEALKPHIWYKSYIDTIEENKKIWQSILTWVKEHKWIKMQVVVFPFCPYFIHGNQGAIAARKKEFLEKIGLPFEAIIDMFDFFISQPECFDDECHLNLRGAYKLSKELSKRMERNVLNY